MRPRKGWGTELGSRGSRGSRLPRKRETTFAPASAPAINEGQRRLRLAEVTQATLQRLVPDCLLPNRQVRLVDSLTQQVLVLDVPNAPLLPSHAPKPQQLKGDKATPPLDSQTAFLNRGVSTMTEVKQCYMDGRLELVDGTIVQPSDWQTPEMQHQLAVALCDQALDLTESLDTRELEMPKKKPKTQAEMVRLANLAISVRPKPQKAGIQPLGSARSMACAKTPPLPKPQKAGTKDPSDAPSSTAVEASYIMGIVMGARQPRALAYAQQFSEVTKGSLLESVILHASASMMRAQRAMLRVRNPVNALKSSSRAAMSWGDLGEYLKQGLSELGTAALDTLKGIGDLIVALAKAIGCLVAAVFSGSLFRAITCSCSPGEELNGLLCYPDCSTKKECPFVGSCVGVGPVCWPRLEYVGTGPFAAWNVSWIDCCVQWGKLGCSGCLDIALSCSGDTPDLVGLLCYKKCPTGYERLPFPLPYLCKPTGSDAVGRGVGTTCLRFNEDVFLQPFRECISEAQRSISAAVDKVANSAVRLFTEAIPNFFKNLLPAFLATLLKSILDPLVETLVDLADGVAMGTLGTMASGIKYSTNALSSVITKDVLGGLQDSYAAYRVKADERTKTQAMILGVMASIITASLLGIGVRAVTGLFPAR